MVPSYNHIQFLISKVILFLEGNGMSTPLNKDMSFNPLGPSAIFQEIMMQPQPQLAVPEKKKCQAIVDLGFILDSSGSLQKDYGKEKDFVKLIARAFNIQYGGSHAGVVTFSHDAELSIRLSETTTYDEFEQDVDRIPHMNSITRIDLALEKAKDELFLDLNGGRHGVKKVCCYSFSFFSSSVNPSKNVLHCIIYFSLKP